uniref:1,4-beta-xylanase n=1 Tax=uncultured microorganism TaxID=358574 RepID=A0A7U1BNC7_9ZZZZ|nr:1,4-beta-xylanase [uncultured microorganism]
MSEVLSLAKSYEKYFKIGATVSAAHLDAHHDLILRHFSSLTAENEMKYALTEPKEGQFQFEKADAVVALAREMGVKMRAHAPVWHNQTGAWMYRDGEKPAAPELIYERIDAHSKALCERYRKDVYAWDVVNEAARDDAMDPLKSPGESPVYRNSEYYKLCGAGFIEAAFRSMDRYAPGVQLFYNDYSECVPEKRERIVRLIRNLQEKGCRIDGMGMQQHYFAAPDYDELKRSIETYAGLGLRIHVTELDISMTALMHPGAKRLRPGEAGFAEFIREAMRATPEKLDRISDIYVRLFEIYRSYADVIDCVTTWGVADDWTWLDTFGMDPNLPKIKQHPLLFDEQGQPKPCVYRIIDAAGR